MEKKGLSLLEIIVATLILALVMTGLAGIFIVGKRYILRTRARMTGGEIGKYFLDPLQMQVRQDTWNTSCLKTGNCPDQTAGTAGGLDTNYQASYNVSPSYKGTTLSKVKVTISWTEPTP